MKNAIKILLFLFISCPAVALAGSNWDSMRWNISIWDSIASAGQGSDVATDGSSAVINYWQADNNGLYSFVAITNPSIQGTTSRAVTVIAVSQYDTASTTLTIDRGETKRIFISNTNHSKVNSSTVADANWISITGCGYIVVNGAYPYNVVGAG